MIIQLKNGSYKGVNIVFVESETSGGNRLVKFNYPSSDNQSIEIQGKQERSFSLTIWIPFDNYYEKRDELLRVLEDGKFGTFVHPTFGDIENVTNGLYTLSEKQSELGRGSVTVTFEVDTGEGVPIQSGDTVSLVQDAAITLNETINSDLSDTYEVAASSGGNFEDAVNNIGGLVDLFESAANTVESKLDEFADFNQQVKDFRSDVYSVVSTPANLAERLANLFVTLDRLTDNPEDIIKPLKRLFAFGDNDPDIKPTTFARIERKKNRDQLRVAVKTQALSYAYIAYAQIEYSTAEDLEAAQRELEEQYKSVRNESISNEALESLDRLRVQGQRTLDNAKVSRKSIITIDTKLMPLTVLVYSYYGNTDLVETIAELNNIKQNAFVEGEIRILSD